MKDCLILRRGDYDISVGDAFLRVEWSDGGCAVEPSRAVCYVWSPTDQSRLRLELFHLEAIPSKRKGEAYSYSLRKDGWELLVCRWSNTKFVVELYREGLCVLSVEWYNNEGLSTFIEGKLEEFLRFVQLLLTDAQVKRSGGNGEPFTDHFSGEGRTGSLSLSVTS